MKNTQLTVMMFLLLTSITPACIYGQETMPAVSTVETPMASLTLASNQHYLAQAGTGQPFFMLADTAWNLDALTDEEISTYLKNRHSHHFNTIMFCLNFSPQAAAENAYNQRAYVGADSTELNPDYFAHVDLTISKAADLHLYVMLYAMWGGTKAGTMNTYSPEQLYTIGLQLGQRFRGRSNVILCAGGESTPPQVDAKRVNAIGRGLKEGCDGKNLIVVHPRSNRSSSESFGDAPWLDMFMSQVKSGHGGETEDMTGYVAKDFLRSPAKPTMLVEHRYEVGTQEDPVIQRRSLYLSTFAGGCGYAYGHNALWQMTPHTAQKWMLSGWNPGVARWNEALDTAASDQLRHIIPLLMSRPYFERIPDQSLILQGQSDEISSRVQATRDGKQGRPDASYILAYMASPKKIVLNTSVIGGKELNISWFNPEDGKTTPFLQHVENRGTLHLPDPPGHHDWVVIIDDASRDYTATRE